MSFESALLFIAADATILGVDGSIIELFEMDSLGLIGRSVYSMPSFSGTKRGSWDPEAIAKILAGMASEARGQVILGSDRGVTVNWRFAPLPAALGAAALLQLTWSKGQPAASVSNYRDIFEHAVEGLFRSSIEGYYLQVNPALAKMYGYESPEQLVSELRDINTQLYVLPTRRAEFIRLMNEQGFVSDFESQIMRADGRVIWIAEYGRVVRAEDGTPLYFEGSVIDINQRRLAEIALRQNEEKYRHLVEMTSVLPWEADLHTGNFTYVGPQAREFLGYDPGEWQEPGFWDRVVFSEDRLWVHIVRGEAMEKRQRFECEYRMMHAQGRPIWVREIVNVLPGTDGRAMLGGFMLDVTYRREAEESLRESQHFIEQVAAASPTILFLFDPVRRQSIYINGRIQDILGFAQETLSEMQPFFILSLAHPDEVTDHEAHFEKLKTLEQPAMVERQFRLRNAIGGWVWLHSRERVFRRDDHTGTLRIVGTIEDITQQRQAIDELESNERMFRRLAETTGAVPFDFDLSSQRFTYVGPQSASLFGYEPRRWSSADFWSAFVAPEDLAEGTRFMRSLDDQSISDFQTEFRVQTADQRQIWVRQIVHRAADEDSHQHMRGFLLDVTEARKAEEERERSRDQLRQLAARSQQVREEERTSIAREIHDELGQALTLITIDLAWTSSRLEKSVSPEVRAPLIEKIQSMEASVRSTLQIVRRILSALRPPLLDELGLQDAIEFQLQEFSKRAGIRYDINANLQQALDPASSTTFFRVFQEILTNIARHARASRIRVSLKDSDGVMMMRVEDNGVGFSEEQLKNPKKFGILGMRERAWSVGGEVTISGQPGAGTVVTLRAPIPNGTSAKVVD